MNENAVALATALLKRPNFEGFRARPYICPAGYWTYGYGSRLCPDGQPVTAQTLPIDKDVASRLLQHTVGINDVSLSALVRVPLSDNERAALLSWQYNVGTAAVANSTLLRKLNAGDRAGAANELLRWNKITVQKRLIALNGLTVRRVAERALFLKEEEMPHGSV